MDITGEIIRILDTKVTGEQQFKSKAVHIKTIEEWPQTIELQFIQGNITLLNIRKPGDKVKITYNLKGREYNKDGNPFVFNTLQAWKIETIS